MIISIVVDIWEATMVFFPIGEVSRTSLVDFDPDTDVALRIGQHTVGCVPRASHVHGLSP